MNTTPAVDKSQTLRAIERTEKLLHELKQASGIVEKGRHHEVRLRH